MSEPAFDLVIPVLNEADNLPRLFERLQALPVMALAQVIFVDNGSTDGSLELLKSYPDARVIEHHSNRGYGASIIDGIAAGSNPVIVILDADGEYPPESIPELLQALEAQPVVYGSRLLVRDRGHIPMPLLKRFGNSTISFVFNVLFRQQLTDLYTGCKALHRSCLQEMTLQRHGFEHVLELSARLSARGYHIHEIPVRFVPRDAGKSKMAHMKETAKFLYWVLRYASLMRAGKLR